MDKIDPGRGGVNEGMSATGVERGGVRRKGELYTGDIDLL